MRTARRRPRFDRARLGEAPDLPGVYRFFDEHGEVIYVGKANRPKPPLATYRAAPEKSRRKKHRRMLGVLAAATTMTWEVTPTHLDACVLEMRLIQTLKPRLNVAGRFNSYYPFIGMRSADGRLYFAMSAKIERMAGFTAFGAFRSRDVTGEGFYALLRLLSFIGHKEKSRKGAHGFRRIPADWREAWEAFFGGTSRQALETLTLRLLESAAARARAAEVEDSLAALQRFWQVEAVPLRQAIRDTAYAGAYPVPQDERDLLFIRWRLAEESERSADVGERRRRA
jgi:GIY-YIG catalytic domain-containing protein